MNKQAALACLLLSIVGLVVGCGGNSSAKAQEVTFDQLFAKPDAYNGRKIILQGFYFGGFEVIVVSEKLEYSGYAPGHIVPTGRMAWIEGGIPGEVYDKLYQQEMMGPSERYGKVRVTGRFEYGGKYGHLGGYNSQIIPSEVELLQWSPLATQGEPTKSEGFAILSYPHKLYQLLN